MSDGIERLLRESHPPTGMLASPIPQYRNPDTGDPEPVEGQKGSPFATLLDADGNPISPATTNKQGDIINALETLASTLGTETTLAAVLQALQGTLGVSGDVNVSGAVDVSSDPDRELGKVTLTGQNVELVRGVMDPYIDIPPHPLESSLITIRGQNPEPTELLLYHHVPGVGRVQWMDGWGDPVKIQVPANVNAVFGPFRGFPKFDGGRIVGSGPVNVSRYFAESYDASTNSSTANRAFDEQVSDDWNVNAWFTPSVIEFPQWLCVQLTDPYKISTLMMWGRDGTTTIKDFELQGSHDGDDWEVLLEGALERNGTYQEWDVPASVDAYTHYRLFILSSHLSTTPRLAIHDLRLYTIGDSYPFEIVVQGGV